MPTCKRTHAHTNTISEKDAINARETSTEAMNMGKIRRKDRSSAGGREECGRQKIR